MSCQTTMWASCDATADNATLAWQLPSVFPCKQGAAIAPSADSELWQLLQLDNNFGKLLCNAWKMYSPKRKACLSCFDEVENIALM